MDEHDLTDPNALAARLEALAAGLNDAERRAIGARLAWAGLAPGGAPATAGGAGTPGSGRPLLATLGAPESATADPARVTELCELLTSFALVIDQLVWRIWRDLSPNSGVKRPPTFKADMARFVAGDAEVTRAQVRDDIERLRKVVAGLTSAAPRAGELFATRHVENLAPAAVEGLATRGPMPMMGNARETACWRKYVELAKGLDAETLTRDLLTMWGESAEKIITGGTR